MADDSPWAKNAKDVAQKIQGETPDGVPENVKMVAEMMESTEAIPKNALEIKEMRRKGKEENDGSNNHEATTVITGSDSDELKPTVARSRSKSDVGRGRLSEPSAASTSTTTTSTTTASSSSGGIGISLGLPSSVSNVGVLLKAFSKKRGSSLSTKPKVKQEGAVDESSEEKEEENEEKN